MTTLIAFIFCVAGAAYIWVANDVGHDMLATICFAITAACAIYNCAMLVVRR